MRYTQASSSASNGDEQPVDQGAGLGADPSAPEMCRIAETGCDQRVPGDIEEVGERREGVETGDLVDPPEQVSEEPHEDACGDEQPCARNGRPIPHDADDDADDCAELDGRVDEDVP